MKTVIASCVRSDMKISVLTAQWVAGQILRRQSMGAIWGNVTWDVCPGNYIDAQRNYLVECHRDAEAILFLDGDVCPPVETLDALCELNVPVAAALCPINVNGLECWNFADDVGYLPRVKDLPNSAFTVERAGTACMLIQQEVFGRIPWPWFKTETRHATPDDGELLNASDDEYFCDKARCCGIEIWAEPSLICQHPV